MFAMKLTRALFPKIKFYRFVPPGPETGRERSARWRAKWTIKLLTFPKSSGGLPAKFFVAFGNYCQRQFCERI
ncbi:hypothetical protein AGR5A_pa30233 [Agrobacterium genomosp. 5 str. CFBP 6626]|nr:hypothetical protein AGR5A_pa30233 [Agrobacterium genomosp. 5 str. CFBP 6626]